MSIRKNYSYNLLLTVSNVLFPIIAFPYVSRVLNPEGIGEVQFVLSFARYFGIVAGLGIPVYGISKIAVARTSQVKLDNLFSELILINIISSLILSAVYIFALMNFNIDVSNTKFLSLGIVIILLSSLELDWFFNGLEDFKLVSIRTIIIRLIGLITLFLFVRSENDTLPYLLTMLFILVGNNIFNVFLLNRRVRLRFSNLNFKQHLPHLFFILSTTFAATAYTSLDAVILGLMNGESEVGYYTASMRLSKAAIPFITAFCAVLIPKAANSVNDGDKSTEVLLLKKSFLFISLVGVPIMFGLMTLSEPIISLFSGEKFIPAAKSLFYLSSLPLFIGFGYFFAYQILIPHGRSKKMFISALIGLVTFLSTNLILVPVYGFIGSAVAIASTELVVTLAYIYFVPRSLLKSMPWKQLLWALVLSIFFIPINSLLELWMANNLLLVASSIFTCAGFYFTIQLKVLKNPLIKESFQRLLSQRIYAKRQP